MPLLTAGFDSIIGTDFELQLPSELKVINPEGASIVDGKQEGKAIRLTNGAYLQFYAPTLSSGYLAYVGFSFKLQDVISAQELAQVSINSSTYKTPYKLTNSVSMWDMLLFVKDGQLTSRRSATNYPLVTLKPDQYYYLEIRHQFNSSYQSGRIPYVEIWLNGIMLSQIQQTDTNGQNLMSIFLGSNISSVLDIDDLYIFTLPGNFYTGHTYTDNYMPILASGKVKTISVVNTQSNTFDVTGATSAHKALSDNSDATFLSSYDAAESLLNVDTNVDRFFSANLNIRASSDSDGVLSTLMSDSTGAEISGSKQTIAFGVENRTLVFPLAATAALGEALSEKIKAGTTLKVTT